MNKRDTEKRKELVRARVAAFQHYVATYSNQPGYQEYSDKTWIDDILYGLGICMKDATDYTGPGGYERFKQYLREHLK